MEDTQEPKETDLHEGVEKSQQPIFRELLEKRLSHKESYPLSESQLQELQKEYLDLSDKQRHFIRLPDGSMPKKRYQDDYQDIEIRLEENRQEMAGRGKGVLNLGTYKPEDAVLVFNDVENTNYAAKFVKDVMLPLVGDPERIKNGEDRYVTTTELEKRALEVIDRHNLFKDEDLGDAFKCSQFFLECLEVIVEKEIALHTKQIQNEGLEQTLAQAQKLVSSAETECNMAWYKNKNR